MRKKWCSAVSWEEMYRKKQQGAILLEAAWMIPLLALLVMTAASIFLEAVRIYFIQLADIELEQEMQSAFQRVVEEGLKAEDIQPIPHRVGARFVKKQNPLVEQVVQGDDFSTDYWLHKKKGLFKLVIGSVDAPLTGDHALAGVTVLDFAADPDEGRPGIYHLHMVGKSEVTNHEYNLCSAVYLPVKTGR